MPCRRLVQNIERVNEDAYMGFVGRSKITNYTKSQIVEAFYTRDFDSFEDLIFRFGVEENELRELIEEVLQTKPINKPRIVFKKSKI